MKIGLLVECGREGLEVVVCRKILSLIASDHGLKLDPEFVPMGNKPQLLEECGAAAANLLAEGCERVVVLWDERPAWPKMNERLCWSNDRAKILGELTMAGVSPGQALLVCIEREFESWLLFDHQLLECVLSTAAHPVKIPKQKRPDRHKNPKGLMISLFRQLAGKAYVDVQYAKRIADCLTALNRLRKCATFQRFESFIAAK